MPPTSAAAKPSYVEARSAGLTSKCRPMAAKAGLATRRPNDAPKTLQRNSLSHDPLIPKCKLW